ncbi:hypothetical protein MZM54_02150 [[Brevibacterium] frigoritolerans]|nr:hypothetical protein [Peribacillus frigoritolerans]
MDKDEFIQLLQTMDGDVVKVVGRVSDEYLDIGEVELLEDGSILVRPE